MLGAASPVVQMPLKLHVTLSGGGRTLSLRGRASGRTSHTHGFATCRGRLGGEGRGSGEGQLGWGWPAGWRAATPGDAGEEGRSPSRGHAVSIALSGPPRPPAGAGGRRASPGLGLAWTHVRSGRRPTDTPRPAPMPATCPPPAAPPARLRGPGHSGPTALSAACPARRPLLPRGTCAGLPPCRSRSPARAPSGPPGWAPPQPALTSQAAPGPRSSVPPLLSTMPGPRLAVGAQHAGTPAHAALCVTAPAPLGT